MIKSLRSVFLKSKFTTSKEYCCFEAVVRKSETPSEIQTRRCSTVWGVRCWGNYCQRCLFFMKYTSYLSWFWVSNGRVMQRCIRYANSMLPSCQLVDVIVTTDSLTDSYTRLWIIVPSFKYYSSTYTQLEYYRNNICNYQLFLAVLSSNNLYWWLKFFFIDIWVHYFDKIVIFSEQIYYILQKCHR